MGKKLGRKFKKAVKMITSLFFLKL